MADILICANTIFSKALPNNWMRSRMAFAKGWAIASVENESTDSNSAATVAIKICAKVCKPSLPAPPSSRVCSLIKSLTEPFRESRLSGK